MSTARSKLADSIAGLKPAGAGVRGPDETRSEALPARTGVGYTTQVTKQQIEIEKLQSQVEELQKTASAALGRRLPLERIDPNPWQPRTRFNDESMAQLRASIKASGVLQPIVVRTNPTDPGRYQIVVGERRVRASRAEGLPDIPALFMELSDEEMALLALAENVAREDLTDYEIFRSIKRAETQFATKKEIAEVIGVSRTQFWRLMTFDKLPGYAIESLNERVDLITAKAAEALFKFLATTTPAGEEAMRAAWQELLAGKITPLELDAEATRRMNNPRRATAASAVEKLFIQGKPVGFFKRDKRNLTIKLSSDAITPEQEVELRAYVHKLTGPKD